MNKNKSINKIIEEVSKKFLGKMGILGITNEGEKIIFYSNLNKMDYKRIPRVYAGYHIYIRPSEKFSLQV